MPAKQRKGRQTPTNVTGYYTVREAADKLGLAECTVRQYCYSGTIRAEKLGIAWIIPRANFEAYKRHRRPRGNPNLSGR